MRLIIDADPIVYRCGFASERADYHLVVEDGVGIVTEAYFTPKDNQTAGKQMQDWLKNNPDVEILQKDRVVFAEPVANALEAVNTQINSILYEVTERYGPIDDPHIVLSGPGNYRERIATLFPYKGNRDPDHKPTHYQAIRNYLTGYYGAKVVHGREADDECSIAAQELLDLDIPYMVATIDKDLDQIPGMHYNYLKKVFYDQPDFDAATFFYKQCLTGDATDGIPGCYKIGEVRGERIIAELISGVPHALCSDSASATAASSKPSGVRGGNVLGGESADQQRIPVEFPHTAVWRGIVAAYATSQGKVGCPYATDNPEAVALETARLVYLQKREGELWTPPGLPMDVLEEYRDDK